MRRDVRVHDRDGAARLGGSRQPARSSSRSSGTAPERRADRLAPRQPRRARASAESRSSAIRSTFAVGEELQAAYDVIGFDPRGVGESTAVRCYDAADMDDYLFDMPRSDRADRMRGSRSSSIGTARFAEACDANSDGILPYITTENSARDMDLHARRAGRREAALPRLLLRHLPRRDLRRALPRAGRAVWCSTARSTPRSRCSRSSTTQAVGFEVALRAYMADCLAERRVPVPRHASTRRWPTSAHSSRASTVDPLPASDGRSWARTRFMTAIVAALYSEDSWPYLTIALTDALQGNPDVAFLLADFYYDREDGVYIDNSTEAFRAYNCMDYPIDCDTRAEGRRRRRPSSPRRPDDRALLVRARLLQVWPYPPTGVRAADHRGRRGADRGRRHHERPCDAVRVGRFARGSAVVGRAGDARRRGSHRLQQGQRVRRRCRRGVPARGHGARGRTALRVAAPQPPQGGRARFASARREPVRSLIVHRASEVRHLSSVGRAIHS